MLLSVVVPISKLTKYFSNRTLFLDRNLGHWEEPSVRFPFEVADWNVVDDKFVRLQPVVECRELLESVEAIWLVIDGAIFRREHTELESGDESIKWYVSLSATKTANVAVT